MTQSHLEMHHVHAIRKDDVIELRQTDSSGEDSVIVLHAEQVRLIADEFTPDRRALIDQRTAALHVLIEEFYFNDSLWSEVFERCGNSYEIHLEFQRIVDASNVVAADLFQRDERARNENCVTEKRAVTKRQDVTKTPLTDSPQTESRRGRPPTGAAKTNAERQAEYRARNANNSKQLPFVA